MKFNRIYAVFLRYFYPLKRLDFISDLLFWPLIDIFLWGLTSIWIRQEPGVYGNVALAIMCGLLFWQIIWRTQYDIAVNLLNELWARNLTNMFSSPLTVVEWIFGVMLLGVLKALFAVGYASGLIYLLYTLNIFEIGWSILPFFFALSFIGWTLGFLSSALMVYFGQRLQQLAWMTPWVIAPFSAIFYPLEALPTWAQSIGHCLPTTPFFEEMRSILHGNPFTFQSLIIPFLVSVLYLVLSILFFSFMFQKRKEKGLMGIE